MKQKHLLFLLFCIAFSVCNTLKAQTALAPGDIAVFNNQADTPDKFSFVTFVDLAAGTAIYFSDCGVVPSGTFDPGGCSEGAVKYTVPSGGLAKGTIVTWTSGATNFSNYSDPLITGSIALSTGGDQVLVFQDASNPGGSTFASANPKFIFIINNASTLFTGDDSASSTQTGLPTGLSDTGLPRTALGVGSGSGPSDEYDNTVYIGTYTFANVADAKKALTNPANYYGSDINPPGDAAYDSYVSAIPAKLTLSTLSALDMNLKNNVNIFPNPSNGKFTIQNSAKTLQSAKIYDANGRIVRKVNLNRTTRDIQINLAGKLSSGVYYLELQSEEGSILKKLIIK